MDMYCFNPVLQFLLTNCKPFIFNATNGIIGFKSTVLILKKFIVIFPFMLFICLVDYF